MSSDNIIRFPKKPRPVVVKEKPAVRIRPRAWRDPFRTTRRERWATQHLANPANPIVEVGKDREGLAVQVLQILLQAELVVIRQPGPLHQLRNGECKHLSDRIISQCCNKSITFITRYGERCRPPAWLPESLRHAAYKVLEVGHVE